MKKYFTDEELIQIELALSEKLQRMKENYELIPDDEREAPRHIIKIIESARDKAKRQRKIDL